MSSLATILTNSSSEFVFSQMKGLDRWIGLSYTSNKFTWINGDSLDFEKWAINGKTQKLISDHRITSNVCFFITTFKSPITPILNYASSSEMTVGTPQIAKTRIWLFAI